eukprot:7384740-Prymnesium_polylepis.1
MHAQRTDTRHSDPIESRLSSESKQGRCAVTRRSDGFPMTRFAISDSRGKVMRKARGGVMFKVILIGATKAPAKGRCALTLPPTVVADL